MSGEIKPPFWNRSTFMIITGASQGIGKNLAIKFSRLLESKSTVLLLARSEKNLQETRNIILAESPTLNVNIYPIDLSDADDNKYRSILDTYKNTEYQLSFLVHNAGSIITDVPACKISDKEVWDKYMSLNLYSVTALTAVFLELFKSGERCIVNISSLAAFEPLKGLAYYCVAKASREMYFRVLAKEDTSLNILNYSPGPIDTAMLSQIVDKCCDTDTKTQMSEMKKQNSLVKMDETVRKIILILKGRNYQSGARIDFFDDVTESNNVY